MRKKIVFDANPIAIGKKTGVGMYTQRLIVALAETYPDTKFVGYYFNFLGRKKVDLPKAKNIAYKPIVLYPGRVLYLLRRFGINIPVEFLAKTNADIALYPNFLSQPSLNKVKSFAVLHDLSFIDHPEYASDRNRKDLERFIPKTIERCSGIITVSEVSKQTITSTYNYPANKILVTPIPPEKKHEVSDKKATALINKFGVKKPYVLYLGTLEPRKNLITLLEAYEQNTELNSDCELVLAGGTDWKFEQILAKIKDMQKAGLRVTHCGYVSNDERAAFYQNASLFVLPSHFEGFGMMILEAMQYDVPVAASNLPVFHEIAGDAIEYFDKDSPNDISKTLLRILNNAPLRKVLSQKSKKVLAGYSWSKVAESLYKYMSEPK
jgi:glycosyltransferase involved in cell wall biosynthesis